jgi:hypothetical protein
LRKQVPITTDGRVARKPSNSVSQHKRRGNAMNAIALTLAGVVIDHSDLARPILFARWPAQIMDTGMDNR